MRVDRFTMKWILVLTALLSLAMLITGCGGGGGGGGGSNSNSGGNYIFSGFVLDSSNNPISGATISFNGSQTYATVSNTSGVFSISVPKSAVGTNDILIVQVVGTDPVNYTLPSPDTGLTGIKVYIGPPAPPS